MTANIAGIATTSATSTASNIGPHKQLPQAMEVLPPNNFFDDGLLHLSNSSSITSPFEIADSCKGPVVPFANEDDCSSEWFPRALGAVCAVNQRCFITKMPSDVLSLVFAYLDSASLKNMVFICKLFSEKCIVIFSDNFAPSRGAASLVTSAAVQFLDRQDTSVLARAPKRARLSESEVHKMKAADVKNLIRLTDVRGFSGLKVKELRARLIASPRMLVRDSPLDLMSEIQMTQLQDRGTFEWHRRVSDGGLVVMMGSCVMRSGHHHLTWSFDKFDGDIRRGRIGVVKPDATTASLKGLRYPLQICSVAYPRSAAARQSGDKVTLSLHLDKDSRGGSMHVYQTGSPSLIALWNHGDVIWRAHSWVADRKKDVLKKIDHLRSQRVAITRDFTHDNATLEDVLHELSMHSMMTKGDRKRVAKEKKAVLYHIDHLRSKGVNITRDFTVENDSLESMLNEVSRHNLVSQETKLHGYYRWFVEWKIK